MANKLPSEARTRMLINPGESLADATERNLLLNIADSIEAEVNTSKIVDDRIRAASERQGAQWMFADTDVLATKLNDIIIVDASVHRDDVIEG